MKMRRRLGVSPGPVTSNGPVMVRLATCGSPVWSPGIERGPQELAGAWSRPAPPSA